jgi:hypothetical protein
MARLNQFQSLDIEQMAWGIVVIPNGFVSCLYGCHTKRMFMVLPVKQVVRESPEHVRTIP